MNKIITHLWIPLIAISVVVAAVVTVSRLHGVFGSHQYMPDQRNADPIVSFNPKRVIYEINGPAGSVATISYLDADAQPHQIERASLPWSLLVVTTSSTVVANVIAQGNANQLGCRITVNGTVRDERMVEVPDAQTSCLVKAA